MAGLLDSRGGKKFQVIFVSVSGREYLVTLTATGAHFDPPPALATERPDGTVETADSLYSSMEDLAVMHGCIIGGFESIDEPN